MPTTITREQFDLAKQFTVGDIRREVELAKAWLGRLGPESQGHLEASGVQPSGGGNLLAALGLLCYTEFFGLVKFDRRYPSGYPKAGQRKPSENFNSFFDELGPDYVAFRAAHDTPGPNGRNLYNILRCGMAHEYFVKHTFTALMPGTNGANIGVRLTPSGTYEIVVEKYLDDFAVAVERLSNDRSLVFPLTRA
jgi:hypothetical protein